MWQAQDVVSMLGRLREFDIDIETAVDLDIELVAVDTLGDRTQALGTPLHELGGQGVFVKEVQAAVLDGRADIAVHSAKDLPGVSADGLTIACVPRRDDVRDGLVGSVLADLPVSAVVATGSVRRRAQLAGLRPDLRFVELRGNMHTRVKRIEAGDVHAVVVGCAGLDRLGLGEQITERLEPSVMLPQVGQAAIAVECRTEDQHTYEILRLINQEWLEQQVLGERAFLARLGAGCQFPVGAMTDPLTVGGPGSIDGLIAAVDGSRVLRHRVVAGDNETVQALGTRLADELVALGGREILGWS
jgi:hydroxymethylbilane synthase